ncbi:hypothetical protein JHK82_051115 [Glycine max]|nr:hypothetical protein JHK82_051115 [Glycine max]
MLLILLRLLMLSLENFSVLPCFVVVLFFFVLTRVWILIQSESFLVLMEIIFLMVCREFPLLLYFYVLFYFLND